jgi:glutamine---fructose-6-phosphate transaminase (isomerizing)
MCGIVGYVGEKQAAPLLVAGLRKLEYRGYDSAGLAVLDGGVLNVLRATGKLKNLEARVAAEPLKGTVGIGHTRWATHGRPSDENAHPHSFGGVSVVHNGIIENHLELKAELRSKGHQFSSETDSEVFAHLIAASLRNSPSGGERGASPSGGERGASPSGGERGASPSGGERGASTKLEAAVREAVAQVKGTWALAVVSEREPNKVVVTRVAQPMVLGVSPGQAFVASDIPALLEHTRDVVFLEDGDVAVLTAQGAELTDKHGQKVERPLKRIEWSPGMAEKGGYKHFMLKEIFEQPRALADTLRGRLLRSEGNVHFEGWTMTADEVKALSRVTILGCGTSYHAGLAGRWMIETLARLPVDVELASEFRYRNPLVDHTHLAVAISQSGETLDTLAAMREAASRGARTMTLCNVVGSAMTREAQVTVLTNAGPEIGVASTKAFTTQLAGLYMLAVKLGVMRGTLSTAQAQEHLHQLSELPKLVEETLHCDAEVRKVARHYMDAQDFLFLGRGPMQAVALEGALKLKEISYIHAEGYAGGEMKHGPIALIDEKMPVVVVAPSDPKVAFEKMLGNLEEVRARGGKVIAVIDGDIPHGKALAEHVIRVPKTTSLLAPIVNTVPLQLLAYHVADLRGNDVDQPRNLAKSVTVE